MCLTGFSGCRVVSCSLVVSGTLHEHPAHKNNNVKAKMEIHLEDGGEQRRSGNCEIDASLLSQKKLLLSASKTESFANKNRKLKKSARTVDPMSHCPHIALFSFH